MKTNYCVLIAIISCFSAQVSACEPYLISNSKLTSILDDNIRNAGFTNAKATAQKDSQCSVALHANHIIAGSVSGCAKPDFDGSSIGLKDIVIVAMGKDIPIGKSMSDVQDDIKKHCGELLPIKGLSIDNDGVFVTF